MPSPEGYYRSQRWIPAINDAGENIPAFAVIEITDVRSDGVLRIAKTSDPQGLTLAIVDHLGIPLGKIGYVTQDFPAVVLSGGISGTPGILVRPKVGAYTLDVAGKIANLVTLGDFSGSAGAIWVDKCNRCQVGT